MVEDFDIGPLTWVKDEIDQALKSVLDNISSVLANLEDVAPLKFSQTHLYQVSGALDMVGLEGCKRFCAEIEKLAGKIEKKTVEANEANLSLLAKSVQALADYLQDLLNGLPDVPLRLYPLLKEMGDAQNEVLEEAELFFPDTSIRAPKDLATQEIAENQVQSYVLEQRNNFQKYLLNWLKSNSDESLHGMRTAIENVLLIQTQAPSKALWWAVCAFIEAIADEQLAANNAVKRFCRRIDQQLKTMAEGTARATGNLLRDALYFVAISNQSSDLVGQVKSVFELRRLLPGAATQISTTSDVSTQELEQVEQLVSVVDKLKDYWTAFSDGDLQGVQSFLAEIAQSLEVIEQLSNNSIKTLISSIHEIASALDLDVSKVTESAFIEVAAGLNLLEDALRAYRQLDADGHQKLLDQSSRIQAVLGGGPMADTTAAAVGSLDPTVLKAVAQQVKDALKVVEQSLDTYFRNPENTAILSEVDKPLLQVIAAFDMLEMALPANIAKLSSTLISEFVTSPAYNSHELFELVAESLSMLGFYVDELPRVRPESYEALEQALARLDAQIKSHQHAAVSAESEVTIEVPPAVIEQATPQPEPTGGKPKTKISVSVQVGAVQMKSAKPAPVVEAVATKDRADDAELLDIYLTESEEVLANVAQHLQALRVNLTDSEALLEVRRGFHTLKGSGRTVGLKLLGEVAGSVEKLLNLVLDNKYAPTLPLISFVENVSAAFANWSSELRTAAEVAVNAEEWVSKAGVLWDELNTQKPVVQSEDVLIGGTHKISRGLFNIFITEAKQHMQTLQEFAAALNDGVKEKPTDESRRAAHTLASNAGTAGFKAMGDLSRALEHWLDAHNGQWTDEAHALYQNVVNALDKMLTKAIDLKQPKQSLALLNALKEAILAAGEQEAAMEIDLAVPAELLVDNTADEDTTESATDQPKEMNFDLPELDVAQQSDEQTLADEVAPASLNVTEQADAEQAVAPALAAAENLTAVDQELLTMFIEEAKELVPQVGNALRSWRATPDEADYPDALQRALHTLKGSARMANQSMLGDTIHGLEDRVIKVLKSKKPQTSDFEDMFAGLDQIGALLEETMGLNTGGRAAVGVPGRSSNRRAQYLRLRADVLDRLINEAGEISIARSRMDREMQGFKQFSLDLTESVMRLRNYLRELEIEAESQLQSRMTHLQETNETFDPLEFDRFTRLQELTRMMAESVNDVSTIQQGLLTNLDETDAALQQQNRMNRELQHGLMNVRMVPFSSVSERLQRIVRQTSRELDKPVEMLIDGEDVEIDRSVLDKIGAPLEHLLRNAVAHGIESTTQRKKNGKPQQGTIQLKVRHESDEIVLTVTDDGGGINLNRVREKAVENGLFSAEQQLSEQELLSVIFEPGFSTATEVTQVAGRGVGLDSVRSDITALGGRIDVNNASGQGAVFSIYLPVTLSVAQVVIVRSGHHIFALPSVMVEQVQKLKPAILNTAYDNQGVEWAGRKYVIHYLSRLIGDASHMAEAQPYTPVLLLRSGTYQIALHVDEIVGNQEVVMKPIGPQLARVPGMIGATVMGDGKIVLMLNAVQLANREFLAVGSVKISHTAAEVKVEDTTPVIMVVDDSLTMRKVLSRLLEREGYTVLVAKDGMDALQVLQENEPDIILTDIEMPRMDGFEFSRNVRADSKTAHIPIVVISSRTAEKHRKLADEIGINAYLGKPVQDDELIHQVNLLLEQSASATTA